MRINLTKCDEIARFASRKRRLGRFIVFTTVIARAAVLGFIAGASGRLQRGIGGGATPVMPR
jgi:hypothetical protein